MRGLWTVALLLTTFAAAAKDLDRSTNKNWRCGIFIPGKKFKEPLAKFFVLRTLPDATCPPEGRADTRAFKKSCGDMGAAWEKSFLKFDTLWKPFLSKVPGDKHPIDVCSIIQSELGIDNIPAEDEKKYKDGIELGFYYNYCGGRKWKDTGKRTGSKVCCKEGVSRDCTLLLQEIEEEKEKASQATNTTTSLELSGQSSAGGSSGGSSSSSSNSNIKFPDDSLAQYKPGSEKSEPSPAMAIDQLLVALSKDVLTKAEVSAVQDLLAALKSRAEDMAQKIAKLEGVLGGQNQLARSDRAVATSILSMASCINTIP